MALIVLLATVMAIIDIPFGWYRAFASSSVSASTK